MDSRSWIEIAGLILTFCIAPLVILFYRWLVRLNNKMNSLHNNHIPHIEWYLKLLCAKLELDYEDPIENKQ